MPVCTGCSIHLVSVFLYWFASHEVYILNDAAVLVFTVTCTPCRTCQYLGPHCRICLYWTVLCSVHPVRPVGIGAWPYSVVYVLKDLSVVVSNV
jgi:hypothetical protein